MCEREDQITDLQTQIDALHKAALRVSSAAEVRIIFFLINYYNVLYF